MLIFNFYLLLYMCAITFLILSYLIIYLFIVKISYVFVSNAEWESTLQQKEEERDFYASAVSHKLPY